MTGRRIEETDQERAVRAWLAESAPRRAPSSLRETLESVVARPPGDARLGSWPAGRGRILLRVAAAAAVLVVVASSLYLYSRSNAGPSSPAASRTPEATVTPTPTPAPDSSWHVVIDGLPTMEGEGGPGGSPVYARPSGGFIAFVRRWIPPGSAGLSGAGIDPTLEPWSTLGSEVLISADGLSWARHSLLRGFVTGLIFWRNEAVAVGCSEYGTGETNSYAAWKTTDLKSWKASSLPGRADGFGCVHDVAAGPDGLFAWSHTSGGLEGSLPYYFWRSADGTGWQTVTPTGLPANAVIDDLVGVSDGYVIRGYLPDRAAVWYSRDGREWSQAWTGPGPSGTHTYLLGPVFEAPGGGYVSLGALSLTPGEAPNRPGDRLTWTSGDGIHWTLAERVGAPGWVRALGKGPQGYVAAGSEPPDKEGTFGPPLVWTSTDGRAWQPARLPDVANSLSAWGFWIVSDGAHVVVVCMNESLVFLLVE